MTKGQKKAKASWSLDNVSLPRLSLLYLCGC